MDYDFDGDDDDFGNYKKSQGKENLSNALSLLDNDKAKE